jgi:hypothetical protein
MLGRPLVAAALAALASASQPAPEVLFSFDAGFGSNMVLQRGPGQAAVYGFLDLPASQNGATVNVTVTQAGDTTPLFSVLATINVTQQPFGPDWGVRPCPSCQAIAGPFNPWNMPLPTWKALLPPMAAGGNYSVWASCTGCNSTSTINITNVTFGDVWYCTGQSNMWLPVLHTFTRNESAGNITAGNYNNIRVMAGGSGTTVREGNQPWGSSVFYGGQGGPNPWMTAAQAVPDGCVDKQNCPLFNVGATCYYFAQGLAELGVTVPIGIIDTAIGGQRIEEFMDNSTVNQCTQRTQEYYPWWDGQLYGQQILPFVDMTVAGFAWYQVRGSIARQLRMLNRLFTAST